MGLFGAHNWDNVFLPKSKNLRMKTKLFLFFSYLKKNEETINFSIKHFPIFWGREVGGVKKAKKQKVKNKIVGIEV